MPGPASVDTEARVRVIPFTQRARERSRTGVVGLGPARLRRARHRRARPSVHESHARRACGPAHERRKSSVPRRSGRRMKPRLRSSQLGESCAVRIIASDGSHARDLMACPSTDNYRMSWSPDGASLAVTTGAASFSSPAHIEIVNVGTGARRAVTHPPPAHIGDTDPDFSPDGSHIAFVRSVSGGIGDVFVAPIDGSAAVPRHQRQRRHPRRQLGARRPASRLLFRSERRNQPLARGRRGRRAHAAGRRRCQRSSIRASRRALAQSPTRIGITESTSWSWRPTAAQTPRRGSARPAIAGISIRRFHPMAAASLFNRRDRANTKSGIGDRNGGDARQVTSSRTYKSLPRWSSDSRRLPLASRGGRTRS